MGSYPKPKTIVALKRTARGLSDLLSDSILPALEEAPADPALLGIKEAFTTLNVQIAQYLLAVRRMQQ